MGSRSTRIALIVAALLCAVAPLALGASAPSVPQGFVGANVDGPLFPVTATGVDLSKQFDAMVSAGVQSVRVVVDWSYAQPYKSFSQIPETDQSSYDDVGGIPTRFDEIDQIVKLAAQHGLTVLPTVIYTPKWDAASHPSDTIATPKRVGPYANFLTALVDRYGPNGSFWDTNSPVVPIRMWQIWNEPNIFHFWAKQPFQPAYSALLKASSRAIKLADPTAKVVLAGMPNYSWQQLARLYKVKGVRAWFDVVAAHPYTKDPQGVITILQKVRNVMNQNGDSAKPIIADEISWPSSKGKTVHNTGFDFVTTEAGQARNIGQMLPLLAQNRVKLGLMGFDYYTWAGIEDRNGLAFDFSGLERFNKGKFTVKPGLGSFSKAALTMEGCRSKGPRATVCDH